MTEFNHSVAWWRNIAVPALEERTRPVKRKLNWHSGPLNTMEHIEALQAKNMNRRKRKALQVAAIEDAKLKVLKEKVSIVRTAHMVH